MQKAVNRKGRWILATNDLDVTNTTDGCIITYYKNQQPVEIGCRVLKDPCFIKDKIFLKSHKRIQALSMVMTLCACWYTIMLNI